MLVEVQTLEVTAEWARRQGDPESSNSLGTWSAQWAGVWEPMREIDPAFTFHCVWPSAEQRWWRGEGPEQPALASAAPHLALPFPVFLLPYLAPAKKSSLSPSKHVNFPFLFILFFPQRRGACVVVVVLLLRLAVVCAGERC